MESQRNQENKWICTINLKNTQSSYVACLQIIMWLESIANAETIESETYGKFMPFYITNEHSTGFGTAKSFVDIEHLLDAEEPKKCREIASKDQLLKGLKNVSGSNIFKYYLRVQIDNGDNDIADLQYIVLLLQFCASITDRIAIRLLKSDASVWSTNDFFHISHYLRFVQQKYCCFYACYNDNISSLRQLKWDNNPIQKTFLPVLEIDGSICQILNRTWTIETEYKDRKYSDLFQAVYLNGENYGSLPVALFRIGVRMLLDKLSGRKYLSKNSKDQLLHSLKNLICDLHGITPLDMLLLGALGGGVVDKCFDYDTAKKHIGQIQKLSLAISQILENIVNHSQNNVGVFTFRIQRNKEYLATHYPDYSRGYENACLELLVADGNSTNGIVSNFLASNKADGNLKEHADEVCLSHLFGSYENTALVLSVDEEWMQELSRAYPVSLSFPVGKYEREMPVALGSSLAPLAAVPIGDDGLGNVRIAQVGGDSLLNVANVIVDMTTASAEGSEGETPSEDGETPEDNLVTIIFEPEDGDGPGFTQQTTVIGDGASSPMSSGRILPEIEGAVVWQCAAQLPANLNPDAGNEAAQGDIGFYTLYNTRVRHSRPSDQGYRSRRIFPCVHLQ